ncbi:MAG TPA: hypothetical protein VMU47_06765 [Caldimonas sp.]|nr:hypothetical protein [Caldimonas sp.]
MTDEKLFAAGDRALYDMGPGKLRPCEIVYVGRRWSKYGAGYGNHYYCIVPELEDGKKLKQRTVSARFLRRADKSTAEHGK